MSVQQPRAILFDWDNTLVDTWPTIHQALNVLMEKMGHPLWTIEDTKARVRKSMRDAFPDLFGDRVEEATKIYQEAYRAIHLENLAALPGAEDVLKRLQNTDLLVAAVSNKRGDNLRKEIAHLGWDEYFDRVVGAGDAEADKPDPAPVRLALHETGIAPDPRVWFVGDTGIDAECARNTGCTCIMYGNISRDDAEFDGIPIAEIVPDHAGLLALFNQWLK